MNANGSFRQRCAAVLQLPLDLLRCLATDRLIRRCGSRSLAYWSAQQASGAPTGETKRRLYSMAVQVRGCGWWG